MDGSIWFWAVSGILVWTQLLLISKLEKVNRKLDALTKRYNNLMTTRQGRISRTVTDTRSPRVDAQARTTRRDTPDLPTRGGKMSTAVHRKSSHGSPRTDA
jgi:hypothetical protein